MPKQWFYVQGGQKYGPFPSAELKRLATSGTLHFSDMVWCDGMSEWRVASTIQGLFSAHEPTAVKPPSPIHAPPANVPPPLPPAPALPVAQACPPQPTCADSPPPLPPVLPVAQSQIQMGPPPFSPGVQENKTILIVGGALILLTGMVVLLFCMNVVQRQDKAKNEARMAKTQAREEQRSGRASQPASQPDKWGFIDQGGSLVIPCQFDDARSFAGGLAAIQKDGKWGYINKAGRIVIDCKYSKAQAFSEGMAAVELQGKWGFIDKSGSVVIDFLFDSCFTFSENLAAVSIDGHYNSDSLTVVGNWGFIDTSGKIVINTTFTSVLGFQGGIAVVQMGQLGKGARFGIIDKEGRYLLPLQAEYALIPCDDGLIQALNGPAKNGIMDKTGNWLVQPRYSFTRPFREDVAAVEWPSDMEAFRNGSEPDSRSGKWGFVDKSGQTVIDHQFDCAWSFSQGLAPVRFGALWGFIDRKGKTAILPKYEEASEFSDGLARVKYDGKWGYIDTKGDVVVKPQCVDATPFSEGLAAVKTSNGQVVTQDHDSLGPPLGQEPERADKTVASASRSSTDLSRPTVIIKPANSRQGHIQASGQNGNAGTHGATCRGKITIDAERTCAATGTLSAP